MYDIDTIIAMNNPEPSPAPACTEMEFVLPEFWLPALVNCDTTGLDEEDERALDAFLADLPADAYCVGTDDDEASFCTRHDATRYGVLACNCVDVRFMINS